MIQKSDGASLYGTTDLATLVQRTQDYHPDQVVYVVDKRQETALCTGIPLLPRRQVIVPEETELSVLRFWYDERQRR